jgi:NTP pyrophosphatase (non-canonical NTP hydrolase)
VDFQRYQQAAIKTLQPPTEDTDPVLIPLLGLAGEVGSLTTAYKKHLRDGPAHEQGKHQLREELGDVLWYIAALAHRFDLDLDDIVSVVIEFLAELQEKPAPEVRAELEDGGAELPVDSLLIVEILTRVEERYSIAIPADRQSAEATRSVQAFARAVREAVIERQQS